LLVMVLYNAFYMQTIDITKQGIGWLLVATVILIILTLSFYLAYLRVVEMVLVKRNNSMYTKQFKLYKREWELEEIAATEVREMRHDMKQQYMYLRELANSDQKEELIGVLEKLIGESTGKGRLESRTGNLVIDAHINHLWEQSRQKNIALYTDLKVPPVMNILDEDLSVFLGNAIDNALEASESVDCKSREIRIQMTFEKGYLFISLKNRYQGEIKQDERNHLITSKKEKVLHGLGLNSMKRIANKYHGYVDVSWEDNIFMLETILYENT
ncbi:ATP-binding protein, partial [Hungatella effluvii]